MGSKWFDVLVTIDNEVFEDAIKGFSPKDALINAVENWECASDISVLTKEGY